MSLVNSLYPRSIFCKQFILYTQIVTISSASSNSKTYITLTPRLPAINDVYVRDRPAHPEALVLGCLLCDLAPSSFLRDSIPVVNNLAFGVFLLLDRQVLYGKRTLCSKSM